MIRDMARAITASCQCVHRLASASQRNRSICAPPLFGQSIRPSRSAVRQFKKCKNELELYVTCLFKHTYGEYTLTHRGGLSARLYWKQKAIASSSLSHCVTVSQASSTVWASSPPSSRHACIRKLDIPKIL